MTFTRKRIEVAFRLTDQAGNSTTQTFADTDANGVKLSGYRITADVKAVGGASQGEAHLKIYGMDLSLMNQLSTLGRTPVFIGRNELSILAGDDQTGLGLIFRGTISQAYTDLGGAPQSVFDVSAYSMLAQAVQSISPTSLKGGADVALMVQNLAAQMGLDFENNGVAVQIANPYFAGSAKSQVEQILAAAKCEWNAGENGVLAIWPRGGSRTTPVPQVISAETGMVGYPYPSGQGLLGVKTRFNPSIRFGAKVQVASVIGPANGLWAVCSVEHTIESEMPGGQWFTSILGTPPDYLVVR